MNKRSDWSEAVESFFREIRVDGDGTANRLSREFNKYYFECERICNVVEKSASWARRLGNNINVQFSIN